MIGIIVHHEVNEGMEADGRKATQANGEAMKSFAGFVVRYTIVSRDHPRQLTTVTLWQTHEDYGRWTESDANCNLVRQPGIWTSKPDMAVFDVLGELRHAR